MVTGGFSGHQACMHHMEIARMFIWTLHTQHVSKLTVQLQSAILVELCSYKAFRNADLQEMR